MQITANGVADLEAKKAVKDHPGSDIQRENLVRQAHLYKQVVQYMVRAVEQASEAKIYENDEKLERTVNAVAKAKFVVPKHTLSARADGRLRCTLCLATATTDMQMPCGGCIWAKGHDMWQVQQFLFCNLCGAYTELRLGKLIGICNESPWSCHSERSRKRLRDGRHPTTSACLGPCTRYK